MHRHPDAIARWLSERSGQALSFTTSEAYWTRRGPLFVVDGLRVGTGDTALDRATDTGSRPYLVFPVTSGRAT